MSFGPPVHSARTRRMVTPVTPLIFTPSPLVSSIARSSSVNPPAVTNIPADPVFWFLKDRMVLSIPLPRMVTFSTESDSVDVRSSLPSGSSITSPGLARMSASWALFWNSGPAGMPAFRAQEQMSSDAIGSATSRATRRAGVVDNFMVPPSVV